MAEDFKDGFLKTLWLLRNYLSLIVIGGGWVPLLYYHYLLGDKSRQPLRTKDIDLLVDIRLPVVGNETVDKVLTDAGLKSIFKSSDSPPVVHYEGMIDGKEVEIEFLTDQRGAREDKVIEVQRGLNAEALRYCSISIDHAIELTIDDFQIDGKYHPLKVRVPSPPSYIFHKGLIFERRNDRRKRAKDLYYIFDILANCPELKEGVTEGLREFKKKYRSWFSTFARNLQMSFSDPEADGTLMVLSQRPPGAFPAMTDEQFKQYAACIFQALLSEITSGDG